MLFFLKNFYGFASLMNTGPPYFVGLDSLEPIQIEAGTKFELKFPQTSDPDPKDKVKISANL